MARYRLIAEHAGQPLQVIADFRTPELARAAIPQVHAAFTAQGFPHARFLVQNADSRDQVQVSQTGVALRDQPDLPAYGEDVTVLAPTARHVILPEGVKV